MRERVRTRAGNLCGVIAAAASLDEALERLGLRGAALTELNSPGGTRPDSVFYVRGAALAPVAQNCRSHAAADRTVCAGAERADVSTSAMLTKRLEVRPPQESDRARFVELFGSPEFMVFSGGVHDLDSAHVRFDGMLRTATEVPFAKQPVIEVATSRIIGYSGVAWFEFEGTRRLEFGYRLVPEARGRGYATEAGRSILHLAAKTFQGELLAMIDPRNGASARVILKLGFTFWKQADIDGYRDDLYRKVIS